MLEWNAPDGTRYRKLYTFHRNSYFFDLRFEIDNASGKEWSGYLYGQLLRTEVTQTGQDRVFWGVCQATSAGRSIRLRKSTTRSSLAHMRDGNLSQRTSNWLGCNAATLFCGLPFCCQMCRTTNFIPAVTDRTTANPGTTLGFKHLQPSVVAAGAPGQRGHAVICWSERTTTHENCGPEIRIDC